MKKESSPSKNIERKNLSRSTKIILVSAIFLLAVGVPAGIFIFIDYISKEIADIPPVYIPSTAAPEPVIDPDCSKCNEATNKPQKDRVASEDVVNPDDPPLTTKITIIEVTKLNDIVNLYSPFRQLENIPIRLNNTYNRIETLNDGLAQLIIANVQKIFVYKDSGLQVSKCLREEQASGSMFCGVNGMSLFSSLSEKIEVSVVSGSLLIKPKGTIYAVAYFPKSAGFDNETIVFLFEGVIEATPFNRINPKEKKDFAEKDTVTAEQIDARKFIIGKIYITKPKYDGMLLNGFEERSNSIDIPAEQNPEILKFYEKYKLQKWIKRLNADVEKIADGKNILVRGLPFNPIEMPGTKDIPSNNPSNPNLLGKEINFGKIYQGQAKTEIYSIKSGNKTSIPVTIRNVNIQNATNSTDFEIFGDTCSSKTLNPADECQLEIKFEPKDIGGRTAILTLIHDGENVPLTVNLKGESELEPNTIVKPKNDTEDFEAQQILLKDTEKIIEIPFNGLRKIDFTNIEITGVEKNNFKVLDKSDCINKHVDKKCSVKVAFKPLSKGLKQAILEVRGKRLDLGNSPGDKTSILLARINLIGEGAVPSFVTDKEQICFQRKRKIPEGSNTIRKKESVKLTNTGSIPFTITNEDIVQKEKDFRITKNTCTNIKKGDSCEITVAFSPTGRKLRKGIYTVSDTNDENSDGTKLTIQIEGVGKPYNPFSRIFYKIRGYWIKPCQ